MIQYTNSKQDCIKYNSCVVKNGTSAIIQSYELTRIDKSSDERLMQWCNLKTMVLSKQTNWCVFEYGASQIKGISYYFAKKNVYEQSI
jgi:hypothetical protein